MAKEREGGKREGRGEIAGAQALYDDGGFARKSQCSATPSARIRCPCSFFNPRISSPSSRQVCRSFARTRSHREQRISILRLYPSLSQSTSISDFSPSLRIPISYDNDRRTAILFFRSNRFLGVRFGGGKLKSACTDVLHIYIGESC